MKHFTHIYIARKAIALISESISNLHDASGDFITRKPASHRINAKNMHRLFDYYDRSIHEATWVPDDILRDNNPYHIFKLFTDEEFPGHGITDRPKVKMDGKVYHVFSGGLPYRIDHIVQDIVAMLKLRQYNDQYTLRQVLYQYLQLSHYIVDAHVPMHCDLRDDPPGKKTLRSQASRTYKGGKPVGLYMKASAHNDLETKWDDAVIPVAKIERLIEEHQVYGKHKLEPELEPMVTFTQNDAKKGGVIKVRLIKKGQLMQFMIDICIQSKIRGQQLFPIDNPQQLNEALLPEVTREIFADAIGNLLSVWKYIWDRTLDKT